VPTVTIFPIDVTTTTPRLSQTVNYTGSGAALFRALSNTWATDDPAIVVSFAVEQSFDGGTNWQTMCPTTWTPQSFAKDGGLPALQCTAGDVLGSRLLRGNLSASATISVGVTATV